MCLFTVSFMIRHTEYSAHRTLLSQIQRNLSLIETGVILTNKLAVLELHLFFLLLQSHLKWDCCTKVSTTCTSSSSLTVIKAQSVKLSFAGLIGHHTSPQHPISTLLIVGATLCWGDKGRIKERSGSLQAVAHCYKCRHVPSHNQAQLWPQQTFPRLT